MARLRGWRRQARLVPVLRRLRRAMSSKFFGPCDQDGVYHDGGILDFTHDFVVNSWRPVAGPTTTLSYTASPLRRGLWQIRLKIIDPMVVVITAPTGDPVPPSANDIEPQDPPLSVSWGFPQWDAGPNILGYLLGPIVDNGDGTSSATYTGIVENEEFCCLNEQASTACCNNAEIGRDT